MFLASCGHSYRDSNVIVAAKAVTRHRDVGGVRTNYAMVAVGGVFGRGVLDWCLGRWLEGWLERWLECLASCTKVTMQGVV